MRAFIVTTFIGTFAVSEENKIIAYKPFPKNPKTIAEKTKLSEIEIIEEEKKIQKELWRKGYKEFVFSFKKAGVKHVGKDKDDFIRQKLRLLAVKHGYVKDQAEFNQLMAKINIAMTKVKIKKAIQRDSLIVQTNGAIEELDKSINILVERLREWYSLHFPEMNRQISKHEKFVKLVEKFGSRDNIKEPELKMLVKNSMGMDLKESDVKELKSFAHSINELYKLRDRLSKYLDNILTEVAPNVKDLAGPALAAKLISRAGGLKKLARMPSSTIQLLGAEKALFRHLHGRGKPPKHGIISMHPMIQNAPPTQRGKVARLMASKISIAARMDYFSDKPKLANLKKDLEKKIKGLVRKKQ